MGKSMIYKFSKIDGARLVSLAIFTACLTLAVFFLLKSRNDSLATRSFDDFENSIEDVYVVDYPSDDSSIIQELEPERAYSGNGVIAIRSDFGLEEDKSPEEVTRFMTKIDTFEVEPGEQYRVEAQLRGEDIIDTAGLYVTYFADNSTESWLLTTGSSTALKGTTDWQQVSIVYTVPDGANYMRPEFRLYDSGALFVDDLRVTKVDSSEEVADSGDVTQEEDALGASKQVIIDENFEGGIASYTNFDYNNKAEFTHSSGTANARSGKRSLKIDSKESSPSLNKLSELTRWMTKINTIEVKPGEDYEIEVYYKSSNIVDSANLTATFFANSNGNSYISGSATRSNKTIRGNNDWTQMTLSVKVPNGATYMRPEFRLFDKGILYIDDLKISKVISTSSNNTNSSNNQTNQSSKSPNTTNEEPSLIVTPDKPAGVAVNGPNEPLVDGQYKINFPRSEVLSTYWKPGVSHARRIFTIFCEYSHSLNDDPIVYPGQAGRSHKHDFLGNNSLDAHSTTQSILDNGENSCQVPDDRAAYWVPSVYDNGKQIKPAESKFYYRTGGIDPKLIQPMPTGLRMIAGNANAKRNQSAQVGHYFSALKGPLSSPATQTSKGKNQMIQSDNTREQGIRLDVHFPNCWDGKNLWLENSSHMAYPIPGKRASDFTTCPNSHPVPVIRVTFNVSYPEADGGKDFYLSSGPWYTFHADYINGWHPQTLKALTEGCIQQSRYCQAVSQTTCQEKFSRGLSPVPTNTCLEFTSDGRTTQKTR